MNWFEMAYTVLGGLGIFLYGMINLSKSLQAIGGHLIRRAINSLTTNRIIAVFVGMTVTTIVQSSSITTVMVVGFVNAGLMSLQQAIGVIFGANIGTTITGWIIAIKVGKYAWLFIGMGSVGMLTIRYEAIKSWSKVLLAVGMIFLGLETMSLAFKPLRTNSDFINMLSYFSADSLFSLYGTILMGCVLTIVVQSSSAMLGITIALAVTGSITFQTAVALVLGENIGTTITAILAGISGNTNAKRAALAHGIFNVLGVIVISTFFWPYVSFVEGWIPQAADFVNSAGEKPYIAQHIALSHTLFNVTNVIIFVPFLSHLARLVTNIIPEQTQKQPKHLEFLGKQSTLSPELALEQGRMELTKVSNMVGEMLDWTGIFLRDPDANGKSYDRIMKYEAITDNIHQEMTVFMGHILEGELSPKEVMESKLQLRIIEELESVADYCQKTTRYVRMLSDQNNRLDTTTIDQLSNLLSEVRHYFKGTVAPLNTDLPVQIEALSQLRKSFEGDAKKVRDDFLDRVTEKTVSIQSSMTVADILLCFRRIISHSRAIATALHEQES